MTQIQTYFYKQFINNQYIKHNLYSFAGSNVIAKLLKQSTKLLHL
jgi:hypothetical protein